MKRKEKRQRKKTKVLLALPLVILGITGLALTTGIFLPRLITVVSGKSDVKSAYIERGSRQEVIEGLKKKRMKYNSVDFADEGESYKIVLESGITAKISSSKSIPEQIDTLHGIIRRLTIDNKQVKEIDLRFTRPVVKY